MLGSGQGKSRVWFLESKVTLQRDKFISPTPNLPRVIIDMYHYVHNEQSIKYKNVEWMKMKMEPYLKPNYPIKYIY
jgi:hypothetical protein